MENTLGVSYPDALDHWDRSRAFGDPRDFQSFTRDMEELHPGAGFGAAGARDGWWTRLSTRLDQNVFNPVAAETTEPLGAAVGGLFGQEEAGARVGRGLPRALLETAPLYLAGPEAGVPATIAALGGTGGLMAAHTYAETGSPKAALISGATGAALPLVGRLGGAAATRLLSTGEKVVGETAPEILGGASRPVSAFLPKALKDVGRFKAAQFGGSQAAMIGLNQASMYAEDKTLGKEYDPLSPDFWLQQIPFTVYDAVHATTGRISTAGEVKANLVTPTKKTVTYTPPEVSQPEADATIAATLRMLETAYGDPNTPPEQKEAALVAANALIQNPRGTTAAAKFAKPPEVPTEVTGHAVPLSNGNFKVLQLDPEGNDKTVFVNGVKPTTNPDGTVTFQATKSQVKESVTSPLRRSDFGLADVGQEELPTQTKPWLGFRPDEQRTLEEHGVTEPVAEMPEDVKVELRQHAEALDEATHAVVQARAKVAAVPQTAEEIPNLTKPTQFDWAPGTKPEWLTEDVSARSSAVKYPDGNVYEGPFHADADELAKSKGAVGTPTFGFVTRTGRFVTEDEHAQEVTKAKIDFDLQKGATPTQAVEKARLSAQTPQIDAAMQQLEVLRKQARELAKQGPEKVISMQKGGKPQAQYGKYVRDEDGQNFQSRGLAEAFQDADPELSDYVVVAAGKGGKGFYLAKPINKEVSLEGTHLENVLSAEDPSALESRPDVSFDDALQQIQRASQSPKVFAGESGLDLPDAILALKQAKVVLPLRKGGDLSLEGANKALAAAKVAGFVDEAHMRETLRAIRQGIAGFQGYRNFTLDSTVPFDQSTVDAMGLQNPHAPTAIKSTLEWFVNHKDSGVMGEVVAAMLKAHGTEGLNLSFDSHDGTVYYEGERRINVSTLPSVENAFEYAQHFVHEYAHDVGIGMFERTDPAAVQFRATMTESLTAMKKSPEFPREVRSAIGKISGWYQQYHKDNDPFAFYKKWTDTVGEGHDEWLHAVYGLTDEKELFSSMFNSPKLVDVMTKTKMPAKQVTVMQYLSQVWNKIFGGRKESDNVFAQILGSLDNYLSGGKVPTISRPSKYVPAVKFADGRIVSESTGDYEHPMLGHEELLQDVLEGKATRGFLTTDGRFLSLLEVTREQMEPIVYNGRDFLRDSLISKGVHPEALASRLDTVESVFKTGSLQPSIDGFTREMGAGTLPATASAGPLKPELATALTEGTPKDVNGLGKLLLATEVPVHQELYQRMKEDVETAVSLYSNIRKGLIPGELPPNAKENLQAANVRLDALGKALGKQAIDIARFNDLDNFTPTGIERTRVAGLTSNRLPAPPDPTEMQREAHEALGLMDARTETSRAVLERSAPSNTANWIRKTFMFTQYLKQLIPAVRPAFDHVFQLQGQTTFWKNELDAVYGMDPKNPGEMDKGRTEANFRVATNSALMRAASDIKLWNNVEEAAGRKPSMNDPFVKATLARFNPKDRQDIVTEANNAKAVHDHWTEVTTPRFLAQKNLVTVAKVIALREQGMQPEIARDLAGQFTSAIDQLKDPQTAQMGLEMLNALRPKMQPETYLAAFGLAKGLADDTTAHLEFMRSRPNYVTEQRIDGKHAIRMITSDNKPFFNTYGSKPEALAKVQQLEAKGYKFLEYVPAQDLNVPYRGVNEELIGKLRELDLQRQNREAQALQGLDPQIAATVLGAFNRANDYEASLAAFSPVPGAGYPKRHFVAGREELNMVQQQNMFYGRATNWMRHQLTRAETELDLLHPDLLANREATKLVRDHVGNVLSPDSQLARKMSEFTYNWKLAGNFGVNFLHLIQSLNTGMASLIAETGAVGDALALTTSAQKAVVQRAMTGKWANADHDWLDRRAASEGLSGFATWEGDIGDANRNALQFAATPSWQKPAEYLKWAARSWNGMFFKFNDRIGLLSAFDLGRSRGMGYDEAYNFARDVKNQGYFTGGKAQRAVGQWAAFGPQARAVPQLMSSLQTYVQGWFGLLASNYVKGFGRAPEGMSSTQILGAKKAFLYQLGAQTVLAGALGLPGVGQGMALVKQTTGVDVMAWLRQHLADLFDEDQKAGGMITSLALHGATATFTPVDVSGKHMPSVPYIGVTPYKGFDIANLAGAPVSSAADMVKGLMAAAKGDTQGMASLLPEVLKGPLRLWQGEGDVRDKGGNLITKLSPAEQFVTALGMVPSRVNALKDTANAVKEASQRATAEKSSAIDQLATVYRKNGIDQGHRALVEYLQQHPDQDGKSLVRAVSAKVLAQTTVPDWSQKANAGADLTGLGGEATSQADRYSQRMGIEQSLGLRQRPSRQQLQLMDEVDQLRQSDPYLSVAEAEQQVRSQRRPRRSNATWNPEYR